MLSRIVLYSVYLTRTPEMEGKSFEISRGNVTRRTKIKIANFAGLKRQELSKVQIVFVNIKYSTYRSDVNSLILLTTRGRYFVRKRYKRWPVMK